MMKEESKQNLFYAHTKEGASPSEWELLETHLKEVSELAEKFAGAFGAGDWGRIAGWWHDLGKYNPAFQGYLMRENGFEAHLETTPGKINHSTAGGLWAIKLLHVGYGRVYAFLILGHHAGLADYDSEFHPQRSLSHRITHDPQSLDFIPEAYKDVTPPTSKIHREDPALWIRMVFSALVDADFLCTEAFMDRRRAKQREKDCPKIRNLHEGLQDHLNKMCSSAKATPVNLIRKEVLNHCLNAAVEPPGIRTLTVPTGGGKTLSSLAFALKHAVLHGKRKVIYVIPYTSIIEQTAKVFRAIPGFENAVLEHHSNMEPRDETRETVSLRLASENWNMPLVVTTSVQFFESLFAARTSQCRKLHNIAKSVVIFDEAQNLPQPFLQPVVNCIRALHEGFGVTPVLCTATQPALEASETGGLRSGLESREIIPGPDNLQKRLKRVTVTKHASWPEPLPLDRLAVDLERHDQVLCIVHSKKDALTLFARLPENSFHLSTRMCGAHRSDVLERIKQHLDGNKPVRVVSTQLVEAGVDIDFPVVYRAVAGLDSLAQAAGRCNREGKRDTGEFIVFQAESKPPPELRAPADLGRAAMGRLEEEELFSHSNFHRFFKSLFWTRGAEDLDRHGIESMLKRPSSFDFKFRTAADTFKLIDNDWQRPVIVGYGEAMRIVDQLVEGNGSPRLLMRKLQRYTVQIAERDHRDMLGKDYIREVDAHRFPGIYIQNASTAYDQAVGLRLPEEILAAKQKHGAWEC